LNYYGVTSQLITFVPLYSSNNIITLKIVAIPAETSWWETCE